VEAFLNDLRYTLRMLRQNRGFTGAAIATLALGIGANAAIFSVVNAVMLRPIPFPDAERLVMFMGPAASPAKFQHWRAQASVVESVAAYRGNLVNYTGGGFPEQLDAGQVSADYFRLFGAPVFQGRTFSDDEDRPGGERVAVLSHGLWVRRFAGDPAVVGRAISLSGEPYTVIGIIGPTFDVSEFGSAPELWIPFQLDPNATDQGHYFTAAGRLKPGVTLAQAQARLKLSATEYRERFPNALGPNESFSVEPLREIFVRNARPTLLILSAAVAFVLLIACANVANLLLVRATARKRELTIRAAVGAGRRRIVRQLLTESVILSLAGGVIGLALGMMGIRALLAIDTAGLPRIGENGSLVALDWHVVAFTAAVALGTGIVFGLVPALHSSRPDLSSALKDSAGRSGAVLRHNKTRSLLVVAQVALALVLLIGSALLIRTLVALRTVEPGYDPNNVLTMRMSLTGPRFFKSAAVEQLVRDGVERLQRLPGVEHVSATCCVPLEGGYGLPFTIIGRPLEKQGPFHGGGGWATVSPGYFDVFRMAIRRGRAFTTRDDNLAPGVVVINEAMAREFWPNSDPLADRLMIGGGSATLAELAAERERQVIGIVGNVLDVALNVDPGPKMYVPQAQVPDALNALNLRITPMAWVVRTRTDPYRLSGAIQEQLRQASGLPVSDVRSMDDVMARSSSRQRFNMLLMTIFAGSALLLAAIGIYGLMAYSVQQRTGEIGIRMALGAEAEQVRRLVVVQGMRLAVIGMVVGLAAALGLTRLITSVLFGVQPRDPAIFIGIPLLLAAVSFVAVWVPARRASGVDPLAAIRYE
jgi:predicted permease